MIVYHNGICLLFKTNQKVIYLRIFWFLRDMILILTILEYLHLQTYVVMCHFKIRVTCL